MEISKDQISFGIEDPATPRPLQDEIKLTERPRLDKYLPHKQSHAKKLGKRVKCLFPYSL